MSSAMASSTRTSDARPRTTLHLHLLTDNPILHRHKIKQKDPQPALGSVVLLAQLSSARLELARNQYSFSVVHGSYRMHANHSS
jgi:hypothetical protein